MLKKKIWANFQRIIELFTQMSLSCQIYGFGIRDPRSGIRKKTIPDPGSRGQKGTGSRIRIRNTGIQIGFLLSSCKNRKKNHYFYFLRLLNDFSSLKNDVSGSATLAKTIALVHMLKAYFCCMPSLQGSGRRCRNRRDCCTPYSYRWPSGTASPGTPL